MTGGLPVEHRKAPDETYFLFLEFQKGNAVGQQFDVVSCPFLGSPLLRQGLADHHLTGRAFLVAILGVVLLLEPFDVVGHHGLVLLV